MNDNLSLEKQIIMTTKLGKDLFVVLKKYSGHYYNVMMWTTYILEFGSTKEKYSVYLYADQNNKNLHLKNLISDKSTLQEIKQHFNELARHNNSQTKNQIIDNREADG